MNLCGLMAFLNRQPPQNRQERGAGTNRKERDSVGHGHITSTSPLCSSPPPSSRVWGDEMPPFDLSKGGFH